MTLSEEHAEMFHLYCQTLAARSMMQMMWRMYLEAPEKVERRRDLQRRIIIYSAHQYVLRTLLEARGLCVTDLYRRAQ